MQTSPVETIPAQPSRVRASPVQTVDRMTGEAGPHARPTRGGFSLRGVVAGPLDVYGRLGWASIQCLRHLIPFVFVDDS